MSIIERPTKKLVLEDGMIDPDTNLPYIEYPGEYDEVAVSPKQNNLAMYLISLLRQLLPATEYTILGDIAIYRTTTDNHPLAPDVAVFPLTYDETKLPVRARWLLTEANRPIPTIVIEITSYSTWGTDVLPKKKPTDYQNLGVKEYFAYDPNDPPAWDEDEVGDVRLLGWRYTNGVRRPIKPNGKGWLWSNQLNSWLVPDGSYLRLYEHNGQMRLTKEEIEIEARKITEDALKAEAEARKITEDALKAETQARQAVENALKAETQARQTAEDAKRLLEKQLAELKEMLGKQGLEPPEV